MTSTKPVQSKIIHCFQQADHRFLQSMDPNQKEEAIQQFRSLWQAQKNKVSVTLKRRQQAQNNLQRQEEALRHSAREMAEEIKNKIEKSHRKRSRLQLDKLNSYKNMDRQWKDKVLQITLNLKNQNKRKYERVKELNKDIQKFWQNRATSRNASPRSSTHLKTQQYSPRSRSPPHQADFLTQVRYSRQHLPSYKRDIRSVAATSQLPQIRYHTRMKSQAAEISQSVQVHQRRKTEEVKQHKMKSDIQWQEKEENYFQQAMQKVDVIYKRRMELLKKNKQTKFKHKQKRQLREMLYFDKSKKANQSDRPKYSSLHEASHRQSQKKIATKRNLVVIPQSESKVAVKRKQLEEEAFMQRGEMHEQEKYKQHRGKMHKMVRDAVNVLRFQALRHKK